jgi:hypothetical protein
VFFVVSVVLPGLLRLRIAVSQNSLPGVLEEFFHSFSVSLFSFYFVTSTVQDILKNYSHWAWVAHTCNPSYSGGKDQEDCGSKPGQTNSS